MKLEIQDLVKIHEFKNKYYVIFNNASYTFYPGKFYYIYGDAGIGKTTLLNILGLQTRIDEGHIIINDRHLSRFASIERARIRNKKIGYVYDYPVLNSSLTVKENIMLPLLIRKDLDKDEKDIIVMRLLIDFGLENKSDFFPSNLSETEKQKTCLARALVNNPLFILLDEPYKNLDIETIEILNEKLNNLVEEGHTVILASKNVPEDDFKGTLLKIEDRVLEEINA